MILFLKILIAHIITDFFLQPDSWVNDKKINLHKSKYLYYHVLLTGAFALLFSGSFSYIWMACFIMGTHFLIDWYKLKYLDEDLISFLFDQLLHVSILGLAAMFWSEDLMIVDFDFFLTQKNLAIVAAYLFVTTPSGFIVGKATQKWREELSSREEERDSLQNAGIWIGILERLFVLTFFLMNTLQAIGFLIAAKSILRFNSKEANNPRKQTEYVLIGTLISFLIALGVGLVLQWIMSAKI